MGPSMMGTSQVDPGAGPGSLQPATVIQVSGIGTATTAGLTAQNATAAALGAQQYSPMAVFTGAGYKSNATAASQQWDWALQNRPVQGTTVSTSKLHFMSQMDGGGYTSRMSIDDAGNLTVAGIDITGSAGGSGGNAIFCSTGQIRTDKAATAIQATNGAIYAGLGLTCAAANGLDANDAASLKIGHTTATGVWLGKSGGAVGFFGTTPAAKSSAYTVTNPSTDRGLNVSGDTLAQGLAVLGTLIADLQAYGLIG